MNTFWKTECKSLALIMAAFIICFYLPVDYFQDSKRLIDSFWEALYLVRWYAQEHVLLCLIPAFIIAGAIPVFISQAAVMKYLGVNASKQLAYSVASVSGAFMYFATLTEVPILQGLLGSGMGQGPALALLLAGPSLSLPGMLVLRTITANTKTFVYVLLVVTMATTTGMIYGSMRGV